MLVAEMSRKECEDLLARQSLGHLACARENQPYIVPIYFASEPGQLYGFSTMGQKIDWMRRNPLVCVEVDEVIGATEWASVVVQGRYEEFPDTPEYAESRRKAQAQLEKATSLWWQTAIAVGQTRKRVDRDMTVFFCIHIEGVSGRQGRPDPVEHK